MKLITRVSDPVDTPTPAVEEMIYRQKDWSVLDSHMDKIREYVTTKKVKALPGKLFFAPIENAILDRFGLSVKVIMNNDHNISILPLYVQKRHTLANTGLRGVAENEEFVVNKEQDKMLKEFAKGPKGTVDLIGAKVGGIFSKYKHSVYMDFNYLFRDLELTTREVSAIFLHEIGHGFTFISFSHHMTSTNHLLATLTKEAMQQETKGKFDAGKYNTIFEDGSNMGIDTKKAGLNDSKTKTVLSWKMSKLIYEELETNLKIVKYDESSGENMADMFSSRLGYSMELGTSLDKLFGGRDDQYNGVGWYIAIAIAEVGAAIWMVIFFLSMFLGSFVWLISPYIIGALAGLYYIIYGDTSNTDRTYAPTGDRLAKIKRDMIDKLATSNLSSAEKAVTMRGIEDMDKIIQRYTLNYVPTLRETVSNFFSGAGRDAYDTTAVQQQLEQLANNNLFYTHEKLTSILKELNT